MGFFSDSQTFTIRDFFQFLKVANWKKLPCQFSFTDKEVIKIKQWQLG